MANTLEHLRAHLSALSEPRNPVEHSEAHYRARAYIQAEIESHGRQMLELPFATSDHHAGGLNLYSSSTENQVKALLVAHYDTVDHSPGADDNGSAVAVALEVCRNCPHVDILFCDLEERGLLGSRHFVQTQEAAWEFILVLESVGYTDSTPGSQSFPEILPVAYPEAFESIKRGGFRGDFWTILHLESQKAHADLLKGCLSGPSITLGLPDELYTGEVPSTLLDFGRSDHLAFWEQGVPSLMLTDTANFRNPNYHLPSDCSETLDFASMVRLVESLGRFFEPLQ